MIDSFSIMKVCIVSFAVNVKIIQNIMNKLPAIIIIITSVLTSVITTSCNSKSALTDISKSKNEVITLINKVNDKWQNENSYKTRSFWDNAAYHTGNMEAFKLTGNSAYKEYSQNWAIHNKWQGAKSTIKSEWRYDYGETDKYVLFGDWQICFQTYADLYNLEKDDKKIARAIEVFDYQMSTPNKDYLWWADGLYMVMPAMTKLYKITGNKLYLKKLEEYFAFADSLMFDDEYKIYYRDAKYIFPLMPTSSGKKNFWSRGNGWVFASFAKILQDLPKGRFRNLIIKRYKEMAETLAATQQPEGYWVRSILDPGHAPGRETSGTAFFTYGYLWGINNGILNKSKYLPVALKGWDYLKNIAVQPDFSVGYVQPIGERAIPGQTVSEKSTANFGTGAFLLAASEYYRYLDK